MKKQVLIIISVVVIICSFVACTHNSSSETASPTAVTDSNGITHYYEPVTDENSDIVTKENGDVVTTEITVQSKATKAQTISTSVQNNADNVIDFNTVTDNSKTTTVRNNKTETSTEISTDETTTQTSTTTPQKQTQPITDKDGWINKWY